MLVLAVESSLVLAVESSSNAVVDEVAWTPVSEVVEVAAVPAAPASPPEAAAPAPAPAPAAGAGAPVDGWFTDVPSVAAPAPSSVFSHLLLVFRYHYL